MKRSSVGLIVLTAMLGAMAAEAQVIRTNPGFYTRLVPRNDDQSSGLEPLGFTINFFGKIRSAAYVNNNGNLTFDTDLATFTPFGLLNTEREIIAPFFADVDTRPEASNLVTFGQDTVNGHRAFAANYVDVGYYSNHTDKLNRFQVVLIQREDQGPGDFDIEFNYEAIKWETGDASGGVNGFGGTPASAGWSNGTDTSYELPGSLIPGAFLDGGPYSLVRQSITGRVVNRPGAPAGTPGRLIFRARDGIISPGVQISGGQFPNGTVGIPYSQTLTVTGAQPPYAWTIQPDIVLPPGLSLSPDGVLSGTPTAPGTYSFTLGVTANTEDGEATIYDRGSVTIQLPQLSITTYCPINDAYVGVPYSLRLAASGGGATGYAWSVDDPASIPPGLGLGSNGLLAGTPLLPGTYMLSLRAAAAGSSDATPATKLCRLNVNPSSVRLSGGCSLTPGTVGVPYAQILDPVGGVYPYEFQLIGQLPVGIAMTSGGLIAGTPGYFGVYPFKIATTDATGTRAEQDCSMVIHAARFSIAGACPLPVAVSGVPYGINLPGGLTWSVVGDLPAGLTLTPEGRVAGIPMVAGPNLFRLIATNGSGEQAGEACSLLVQRGPLSVNGCPLPDARRGDPYKAALTGVGGAAPYLFTPLGTLPPGLSLATGGQVTGTPSQTGVYAFTVMVRDGSLASAVQACSLAVQPSELRLETSCPLPSAQAGQPYSVDLKAAGGEPPYAFFIDGFLPDGLALNSASGRIFGTPARLGGRSFTIYTFDSIGGVRPAACSLAVTAPQAPEISLADPPATVAPAATNLVLQVRLAAAYNNPIEGKVVLNVSPDTRSSVAVANSPDPHLAFANGQRVTAFSIPAGATSASIPVVSTGTVAVTVAVSLTDLRSSGAPLAQTPDTKVFRIPAAAPSLTSLCFARTDTGLDFRLTGISTTRELTRAVLTIPGLPDPTKGSLPPIPPEFIIGARPGELTVDLKGLSGDYFGSPVNLPAGGAFTLTVPVTVDLAPDGPIGEVGANIFNTVGEAGQRTVQRCQ